LPKGQNNHNFNANQAMKKRSKKALDERIRIIRSARGSLKGKMGDKPFAQRMAEENAEEKELEER
jgi:hypothetical protein